jgi:hypothetical protein
VVFNVFHVVQIQKLRLHLINFKKNKTIYIPKILNILINVSTRFRLYHQESDYDCNLVEMLINKMLAIFGMSIVLFFSDTKYDGLMDNTNY